MTEDKKRILLFTKDFSQYLSFPNWYYPVLSYICGLISAEYVFQGFFCFLLLFLLWNYKEKAVICLCLFVFTFGLYYGQKADLPLEEPFWFQGNTLYQVKGTVSEVKGLTDKRWRLIVKNPVLNYNNANIFLREHIVLYVDYAKATQIHFPITGQVVSFEGKLKPIHFSKNTGILPSEQVWYDQNIYYTASVYLPKGEITFEGKGNYFSRLRTNLLQTFISSLQKDKAELTQGQGMLPALLFGDKFFLADSTNVLFEKGGLIHSLALSGMHLGLAVLCGYVLLKIIGFCFPHIFLYFPFAFYLGLTSLPFAFLYLWIGNAPVSLIRATIMLFLTWIFLLKYRKMTLADTLLLCAFFILLVSPRTWRELGFQLSVLSVFSIALVLPFSLRLTQKITSLHSQIYIQNILKAIVSLCTLSLGIQIGLLPIQVYYFGQVSPYFLLNLLWLPVLELVVLPSALLSLLSIKSIVIFDFLSNLASNCCQAFLTFLLYLQENNMLSLVSLYRPDSWQVIGYYICLLSFVYFLLSKNKKVLFLLILGSFCLFSYPLFKVYDKYLAEKEERISIRVLDVGQGQSVLIEYWAGKILIDGGGTFSSRFDTGLDIVAKVVTYKALPKLDFIFISHFDSDHAKGVLSLLEHFQVNSLLYSAYDKKENFRSIILKKATSKKILQTPLKAGDKIQFVQDVFWAEVLHPPISGNFSSNNASLVLRFVHRDKGIALICGDIEQNAINKLLDSTENISAEVLILPHHGSQGSYNTAFYEKVKPKRVFVSTGYYNSYNFPSETIKNYFKAKNIPLENTAFQGEIHFSSTKY